MSVIDEDSQPYALPAESDSVSLSSRTRTKSYAIVENVPTLRDDLATLEISANVRAKVAANDYLRTGERDAGTLQFSVAHPRRRNAVFRSD